MFWQAHCLPGLKVLWLGGTQVDGRRATAYREDGPARRTHTFGTANPDGRGGFVANGPQEPENIVMHHSNLTDDSLVLLSSLPRMEALHLQDNHFTDSG